MPSDPFRTVPVRHLGHGIAIGQCLAYNASEDIVYGCSIVTVGYVVCHIIHQAIQANDVKRGIIDGIDVLFFDIFASALIPTVLTFFTCKASLTIFEEVGAPESIITYGPMIMGILSLLLAWEPIDNFVWDALDKTLRKIYR